MVKYSIVIPAKDEEKNVGGTIESLKGEFGDEAEIIVVDDGSVDGTSDAAKNHGAKVIRHMVNKGKGAAIKTGFMNASGDIIGFVDADGSTDVKDVRKVFDLTREYDFAIGSRRVKDAVIPVDQNVMRRMFGWFLRKIVNILFGLNIVDTQCGCKALKRDAAKAISAGMKSERFEFDVEMLYKAKRMGYSINEVGVRWTNKGESKVNPFVDSFKILLGLIRIRLDRAG